MSIASRCGLSADNCRSPTATLSAQQVHDDLLDADDVLGKRIISTRLRANVTIREENSMAALEAMSRFAVNPKWLIYLPPTMSPCETSDQEGFLEYPSEALSYYHAHGVSQVVCEEKHMGSRAVVIVCRDEGAARQRFGVVGESGIIYTRTGRRFFADAQLETEFLARLRAAMDGSGFWSEFDTDWACLDCELMPWSAKAQELLRAQYAAVGAAARASLPKVVAALQQAAERLTTQDGAGQSTYTSDVGELLHRHEKRGRAAGRFVEAYRQYCWPVQSLDDLKLAPFHLLATEGKVHVDHTHVWHMETLAAICRLDPSFLVATPYKSIDLEDEESKNSGIDWWLELTGRGGEGMVAQAVALLRCRRDAKGLLGESGRKMPRTRVSADHRYMARNIPIVPGKLLVRAARPGGQAVAGPAGIRAGRRGSRTLRAARASAASRWNVLSACSPWRANRPDPRL